MNRRGFTLLELLIVISILAVLGTISVLFLNPVEYMKQGRDTKRLVDIGALNVGLAEAYSSGVSLGGAATTVYVSLVDTVSTCANLGLPPLPTGYQYHCVTTATDLKKVDGNGWVPVNFTTVQGGSSVTLLPTDPINNAAYFYTYVSGGKFAISAALESDKYMKQSALADGGPNPAKIEMGSDLSLLAKAEGLAGYWPFDEGSGTVATDASGNGNTGVWNTASTYVAGKVGQAGQFGGSSEVDIADSNPLRLNGNFTIAFWAKMNVFVGSFPGFLLKGDAGSPDGYIIFYGADGSMYFKRNNTYASIGGGSVTTVWKHFVLTYSGTTWTWYANGSAVGSGAVSYPVSNGNTALGFGRADQYGNETIDDARIYNRALTASEVQALYKATK